MLDEIYPIFARIFTGFYAERVLEEISRKANIKLNSVALVRERTIPTERPPPVGEVSANFCG